MFVKKVFMDIIAPYLFEMLLPLAVEWAAEQERMILEAGVPLDKQQLADAKALGVHAPERVRLLRVDEVPTPRHPLLAEAAARTGLVSPGTAGLTLRHGIFIRSDCWGQRLLVAHELVHVTQYERLGGFEAFLRPYLKECILPPGYPNGPMEQEAVEKSEALFR